jgi:hypothetical protein
VNTKLMLLMILNINGILSYYIILNTLIKIFDVLLFINIDHENQNKKYDKKIFSFCLYYYNLKGF